jgi:uncharacterized membrane protein (DUF4010 family)
MEPEALPLRAFAIALFLGALVGIEREKRQADAPARGIGGIRTFILFAEAGAIAAWLSRVAESPWIFAAAGACATALVIAGYLAAVRKRPDDIGLTTEIAALVVFLLGGLAVAGEAGLAVALAIATSAILAFKQPMHAVVGRIDRDDLYAGLKLLFATFIVLPVLPDRPVDPWGALNPYRMWWLVILISGLSLVGYVATRWLGRGRGLPLTGLFGGLVSSTAVTLAFARRSRDEASDVGLADSLAAGMLLAWSVMFVRIAVEVTAVHPALLSQLAVPLAALTTVAGIAAAIAYRRAGRAARARGNDVPLRNPFSLMAAMRFAALFAAVLLVVKLVEHHAPGRGLYGVAALAGLTDVDAITLSVAVSARGGSIPDATAVGAILVAAITNTLVKLGIVVGLGGAALARRLGAATAALVAAGAAAWALG